MKHFFVRSFIEFFQDASWVIRRAYINTRNDRKAR